MAAITWQNINGPSLAEASRPLEAAQRGVASMFSGFEDILKRREATQTANWDQTKLNNTNALLSAVQGAKTPEEYAAMEAGLREQMAGYGAQVDAAAGRNALDGRLATLQQRAKTGWEFENASLDQKQAPVRDELMAAIGRRDFLTANILKSGNPELRNMAAIEKAQMDAARTQTVEGYADATEAQNALKRPLEIDKLNSDLLTAKTSRAASEAQTAAALRNSEVAAAALEDRRKANEAALRQASNTAALKDTMYQDGVYSNNDTPELIKLMTDSGIGHDVGERNAIIKRLTELQAKGIDVETQDANGKTVKTTVPLSKSAVKAALLGADDEWFNSYNQGWANNIENSLKKAMQTPRIDTIDGKPRVKSDAVDGYLLYQELLRNNIEDPVAATTKGSKPSKR